MADELSAVLEKPDAAPKVAEKPVASKSKEDDGLQIAKNPQTGEIRVLQGKEWVVPNAVSENPKTGETAYLIGDTWTIAPPKIDYEAGSPFSAKFAVERADNPKEAKLALEKLYGKENAGQDKNGNWWIKQDGKRVSVFGKGSLSSLSKLGTGMIATAAPNIGAVTGAGVGFGLGGPPGAAIGAGIGYMGGKGIDEFAKMLEGTLSKNSGEEAKTLLSGGAANALLQGAPGAASRIGGGLKDWMRSRVFGAEPGGSSMARKMLVDGARPPITSVAPKAKVFQYDQMLRNLISGNPQETRNIAYVQNQMRNVLKSSGLSDEQVYSMIGEIGDKGALASGQAEVGKLATAEVRSYVNGLAKDAADALTIAKSAAEKEGAIFKTLASTSKPIAQEIAGAVSQNRTDFGRAMSAAYGNIDKMTGSAPIIGLGGLKRRVAEQLKYIDPAAVPSVYKRIMGMPERIPIMQAHALRSDLRAASMSNNLTPDAVNFRYGDLADAVDVEFNRASSSIMSKLALSDAAGPGSKQTVKSVVDSMRKVDKLYGEGVAKYKDAVVNKLVASMKSGIEPDATITADLIAKTGYSQRMKTVVSMLKPETKRLVAAADMKNMLEDASKRTAELGYETKGRALMDIVRERRDVINGLYEPIYGKDFVKRLEGYSKDLAAVGGKVDITDLEKVTKDLGPGAVPEYLAMRLDKLRKMDAVVKDNFIGALNSNDPAVVDRAYNMLVQPGGEKKLEAAFEFFKKDSPTIKAIQSYALKDAMASAVVEMPSSATTIAGTALDSYMSKFTKRQQELLFPNGLADDMRILARESRFLFPWMTKSGEQDFGASLAAAEIKGHVPFSLSADYHYLKAKFFGWISDRPMLIRAFAGVAKMPDSPEKKAAKQVLFRAAQSIMNSHTSAPEQREETP